MNQRSVGYWSLYAIRILGRDRVLAGVYDSREDALSAAQRLWKHGLKPTGITGPAGEKVGLEEIERYGADHPDSAD